MPKTASFLVRTIHDCGRDLSESLAAPFARASHTSEGSLPKTDNRKFAREGAEKEKTVANAATRWCRRLRGYDIRGDN